MAQALLRGPCTLAAPPLAIRQAATSITGAKISSWLPSGSRCATQAPATVPSMLGGPKASRARPSTSPRRSSGSAPIRLMPPTIANELATAVFSGMPSR